MDLRKWFSPVPKTSKNSEASNENPFVCKDSSAKTMSNFKLEEARPAQSFPSAKTPFSSKQEDSSRKLSSSLYKAPFSTTTEDFKSKLSNSIINTPFSSKQEDLKPTPSIAPTQYSGKRSPGEIDEDDFDLPEFIKKKT